MDIEGIRNAFSKGGIAVTHNGIIVTYTYKERWVDQSFYDNNREVFLELLEASDRISIECVLGRVIKFVFHNDFTGQEMVFYPPLDEEISLKELEDILMSSRNEEKEAEFCEFFYGTDLENDDEVLSKLREFFNREREKRKTNIVNLPAMIRWKTVSRLATGLANALGFRCEVLEPEPEFDGSVTVFFPEKFDKKIVITGKLKEWLEEIVRTGSSVDIECNINDGFLNLTFYA